MITTLPSPKDVRDLYTDLMGRDAEIRAIDHWAPSPTEPICVAEFVNDQRRLEAVALLDLPAAVYSGACIGLIPAGGAQDMVADKSPSDLVLTNLYEVLNILSSLLNTSSNPHVRIETMHRPGALLPQDVRTMMSSLTQRLDLNLGISGYGEGKISLIAC